MFAWLANRPEVVLKIGAVVFGVLFFASIYTNHWHWFARGGAMLALSGFLVSVREALLYRPATPAATIYEEGGVTGHEWMTRSHSYTRAPIFHPSFVQPDPDETAEDFDARYKEAVQAWEDAEPEEGHTYTRPGDPGRTMRELSELPEKELVLIKVAAIFGVVGTFIWAFGDLVDVLLR